MKKCRNVQKSFLLELCSKKNLKIMKLTILISIVATFSVFAESAYSQNTRVDLNMQDATMISVLKAIEEQSEFFFLYSTGVVNVDQKVDIISNNQKIDFVLKYIV